MDQLQFPFYQKGIGANGANIGYRGIFKGNTSWSTPIYPSHVHKELPVYSGVGATRGILEGISDYGLKLKSQIKGPGNNLRSTLQGLSDDALISLSHVEGHAAALLRGSNKKEAVLSINYIKSNPTKVGPCYYCSKGVSELLKPNQRLWVNFPLNGGKIGTGFFEGGVSGFNRVL